ncbi:MAG: hypothetical protein JWM11_3417 [Planctomycetaceae bacterium]|nr:hypothetical protein [Planctomycetaceae bacterium]
MIRVFCLIACVAALTIASGLPLSANEATATEKRIVDVQAFCELIGRGELVQAETLAREFLLKDPSDPIALLMLDYALFASKSASVPGLIPVAAKKDEISPVPDSVRSLDSTITVPDGQLLRINQTTNAKEVNQALAQRVAKAIRKSKLIGYGIQIEAVRER